MVARLFSEPNVRRVTAPKEYFVVGKRDVGRGGSRTLHTHSLTFYSVYTRYQHVRAPRAGPHIGLSRGGARPAKNKSISRFAPSLITRLASKSPCRHDVGSSGLLADVRCRRVGVVSCVTSPPTGRHPPRSHGGYHGQRESGALCMCSDTERCSPTSNPSTLMRP